MNLQQVEDLVLQELARKHQQDISDIWAHLVLKNPPNSCISKADVEKAYWKFIAPLATYKGE